MEDIDSSPAVPNIKKRPAPDEDSPRKKPLNLTGTQFVMPTPPDTDQSSNASPGYNNGSNARQVSPAPSSSALSSVELVDDNQVDQTNNPQRTASGTPAASVSGQPPLKKRRKLTPGEKLEQQREKEAKAAEKAQQKAKKDEEKAKKDEEKAELKAKKDEEKAKRDEEKRLKDEEKRKKAEEREAKKREKELEEERKAQEKNKKERAQMRLGVWFQKPATPIKDPVDGEDAVSSVPARRRSLSLERFDAVADQIRASQSPCKNPAPQKAESAAQTPVKPLVSDYKKYFLPFELKPDCFMPPLPTIDDPEAAQDAFDHCVNDPSLREKNDLGLVDSYASLERQFAKERRTSRGHQAPNVRQLVDKAQGTLQQPIDLTTDEASHNPMDALQSITRRYLEFHEDVRPAYFGTYTKIRSPRTTKKLCRNPFSRQRIDTDYDYDSEAEWEEPEEGEEILDDEEDEAESQGDADEMDEFLDDEGDAIKRKMITGDLVPTSTGLCWEDERGKVVNGIEGGSPMQAMRGMRIGVLLQNFSGTTIDPFKDYWDVEPVAPEPKPASLAPPSQTFVAENGLMAPPRQPLQPRTVNNSTLDHMLVGAAEGMKGPINTVAATQSSKAGRKPSSKTLSKEDLAEFKEAVVGSQATKVDLLKGLKAR